MLAPAALGTWMAWILKSSELLGVESSTACGSAAAGAGAEATPGTLDSCRVGTWPSTASVAVCGLCLQCRVGRAPLGEVGQVQVPLSAGCVA